MKARGIRRLHPLEPGDPREVGGHRVVGRIGSGGMGTVYAADSPGVHGYLAVKVIHAEQASDHRFRDRFALEARLLSRVNSPSVARFVRADVQAELPWMITEYVPGPTLRHHVERYGRLKKGMLLGLAAGTAEALRAIHAAGVVHRDLKPSNVVLSDKGPKLVDFGIAHPVEDPDPTKWIRLRRMRRAYRDLKLPSPETLPDERITAWVDKLGTPGWISPEQYSRQPTTQRSDVFLWGATVAFAALGHDPFGRADAKEMARRVLFEEPDLEYLPPGLKRVVVAATAKDPDERPDAAELLSEVLALEEGVDTPGTGAAAVRGLLGRRWTEVAVRAPAPPREGARLFGRSPARDQSRP
ncbi:serine/threonine-protein kinase [Nocardiopsis lambiniae]|uniref:non-specific serine/threonine protein kinase n=1 Tax=Nocardiopsis lambiniae TaxID=3075539 RepID=A0ABU2MG29_9ACTN|nr:serine/threonine-protein kinase [Nocardiopsis sp. DSM 44743]MDT0331669.1 serine/threonine-protein kinase [Nocardiopsis sp. DSM 44743]